MFDDVSMVIKRRPGFAGAFVFPRLFAFGVGHLLDQSGR